jgi:hypothetical protein
MSKQIVILLNQKKTEYLKCSYTPENTKHYGTIESLYSDRVQNFKVQLEVMKSDDHQITEQFMLSFIFVIVCGLFKWKQICAGYFIILLYLSCCSRTNYQEGEGWDPTNGFKTATGLCLCVMTIPNLLTTSRIIATPFIGYLVLHQMYPLACTLFVIAGITDLVSIL